MTVEWTFGNGEKEALLKLARESIGTCFSQEKPAVPEVLLRSEVCNQEAATFVTLHKRGNLRGCIGELEARDRIYDSVMRNARNAAFSDPRFPNLKAAELPEISIEISVLTPPSPISSLSQFEPGKHGIILRKHGHKAVFLPQVAPEQGWNREETVTHLAVKAGLAPTAWQEDANFEVFEAIVFGEEAF